MLLSISVSPSVAHTNKLYTTGAAKEQENTSERERQIGRERESIKEEVLVVDVLILYMYREYILHTYMYIYTH